MIEAPGRPTLDLRAAVGDERIRERIRVAAFCLLLAALPFVTAPGDIISDTKLDLAINPARFLARALTLWDPTQFGQLQNQAVGYLFPMGPFFALGQQAHLDPWVIQRLWIALVLIAAFLGTVALAGRLGIGTPWTRILAGLSYAMSPMGLSLLGVLSAQFLPAAMLPWVLLPLAGPAIRGRRGHARAAAQSAAAVAACGGTNASAMIPVLVAAVIFLLARSRPARPWRILAWWVPAVVLATAWWSVPLVLLDKYGVSFLPYTESAAVTTSATSLWNVLRGTEDWTSYLVVNGQPFYQLAYKVATDAVLTLFTGLIAGLGLAGLIRRGLPERRFLLVSLLAGVVIISTGYVSSLGNPLAGPIDHLINGPAAPFRNLWKFDPLIRLPIALGLAHLAAAGRAPRSLAAGRAGWLRGATAGATRLGGAAPLVAWLAVAGLAVPAYAGGLAARGAFPQIPGYWVSAANWLDRHAGHQAVLVVPGAAFSQYLWGSPQDDVLQPLTTVDWAERDLGAIGSPGNERLVEAIDQRLAAGDGSAGLSQVLAQMGVKYVVVRDDLLRPTLYGAWPARVNDALANSPGITRVARFGAPVGSASPGDAASAFDAPYPPVQIYQVSGAAPVASVVAASAALRVYGAPEAVLTLADEGLLHDRPVLLNSDAAGLPAAASVVTDSLRRRVVNFGEVRTSYSPTLTATQPAPTFEATGDFTEPGWSRYQSVAQYQGIRNVTASSSASDIGSIPANWASGTMPYSAVDGDLRTMWESGSWNGPVGQWIQVGFDGPVRARVIRVTFADNASIGPEVSRVEITTAAGRVADRVRASGDPQPLRIPEGASSWLRITVTGLASRPQPVLGAQVGIAEITVPGVRASRVIVAPKVTVPGGPGQAGDPTAVVLAKTQPQPTGCMLTSLRWVCSPSLATLTEEQYGFDQAFTEPAAGRAQLRGSAVLIAPSLVDKYARISGQAQVTASSVSTDDPQDQPRSAFDGDPATTWIAGPLDAHPMLRIRGTHRLKVGQVTIERPPGASGLLQVLISGSGGQVRGGTVGPSGLLKFKPMLTNELTFRLTPLIGPVQITDIAIPGVRPLIAPSGPFRLACGFGPLVKLNGKVVATRVSGTFADLLTGRPMAFTACSPVETAAGSNRVVEPAADGFDIQDVVLGRLGARALSTGASGPAAPARVLTWTSQRRSIQVTADTRSYLVVRENVNAGWQATIGGRPLRAVRLDGWEQAWLLPAGTTGTVTLTYRPDVPYRDALIGGLAALVLIMIVALGARRATAPAAATALGARRGAAPAAATASPAATTTTPPAATAPAATTASARARRVRLGPRASSVTTSVTAACGLLLAGFWLGGPLGAAILLAATWLFMAAVSYRRSRRFWLESSRPRLLTGMVLAALACGAVGERLLWAGGSGLVVTGLWNAVPQVICLVIVGRLAAALILPEP
jgi:arabinofuranan 3-O-arabinosyltransferase